MRRPWLCSVTFGLCLVAVGPAFSQGKVPDKRSSPDDRHSLEIAPTAMHGARPDATATLVVRAGEKVLSRYSAEDLSIVTDLWSPDGKFVAAAQHTVGGGDRVWVFRLSNGKALKKPEHFKPVAGQPLYSERALAARVRAKFPELRRATFFSSGASVEDWTAQNELVIRAVVGFRENDDWVEIIDTYHVSAKGLHLVRRHMQKDPPRELQYHSDRGSYSIRHPPLIHVLQRAAAAFWPAPTTWASFAKPRRCTWRQRARFDSGGGVAYRCRRCSCACSAYWLPLRWCACHRR